MSKDNINRNPFAVDDNAEVQLGKQVGIKVLDNDGDPDGDQVRIKFSATDRISENGGTIKWNRNGTPHDFSDDKLVYRPAAGFTGNDRFQYAISDGNGGMDKAYVNIWVSDDGNGGNNNAPIAVDDSANVRAGGQVGIRVLDNDSDPDGDQVRIKFSDTDRVSENGGTIKWNRNGTPDNFADDKLVYRPADGFTGTDSFTYAISDGRGGMDMANVTIHVAGGNNAPIAVDDSASVRAGGQVGIRVLDNDSDPDGDQVRIKFSDTDRVSENGGTIKWNRNGTPDNFADDKLVYRPAAGFTGTDSFTYAISDGKGGMDMATVTIDVKAPANTAPNASNDRDMTEQGVPVSIDVLANDSDPDGDPLSVTSVESQSISVGQSISTDNGSVTLQANGELNFTPDADFTGNESFSYHVSDGNGGEDRAFVTVEVKPPANNDPNAVNDSGTTEQGVPVSVNVLANDSDPDGDQLSVTSVEDQSISVGQTISTRNGSVELQANGELSFTPDAGFVGNERFSYHVSDGNGGEDTAHVDILVTAPEKIDVDLAIYKETTNVSNGDANVFVESGLDAAFPFDVVRYDITVSNLSHNTATGIVVKDIVPENIDLWQPGQTISDTGFGWNDRVRWGQFTGNPETVDPTNGDVTIVDPGTAHEGLTLSPGQSYGLAEGHVTWELGTPLEAGQSVTLSYYGMREVYSGYNWQTGTQFNTSASIVEVDQHDTNSSNNSDSSRSWWISPITLDLNGDGVQTISIDAGVEFDLLNTGTKVSTGWLSGEDAFLATDDNGNGVIDDRSELFGGGVGEGFAEVASFDSNGDGLVNASDDRFGELLVWQDANENAITDAGELISLESSGIASISTDYTDVFTEDAHGNVLGEFGNATRNDGSSLQVVDAYFQVDA